MQRSCVLFARQPELNIQTREALMMLIDEDGLKLWHGDWREGWPLDCDAVVTDPPYGIKAQHKSGEVGGGKRLNGKVYKAQAFAHIHGDGDKSEAAEAIEAMKDVRSQAWFGGEHLYQFFPAEWTWSYGISGTAAIILPTVKW